MPMRKIVFKQKSIFGQLSNKLFHKMCNSPFWTNLSFACKTEMLGSLYSHTLLILTKSSKSKN